MGRAVKQGAQRLDAGVFVDRDGGLVVKGAHEGEQTLHIGCCGQMQRGHRRANRSVSKSK